MTYLKISLITLLVCSCFLTNAQIVNPISPIRTIITAVPFLTISSSGNSTIANINVIGTDFSTQGVAETNPARMFQSKADISVSHMPWLRALGLNDIYLSNLNGHFAFNERHAIGFHVKYFSLGQVQFRDANGALIGSNNPQELYTGLAYAFRASEHFSLGLNANGIYSKLISQSFISRNPNVRPAQNFSVGVSGLYQNDFDINRYKIDWSVGVAVTDIGSKVSYVIDSIVSGDFMPTNLALGGMIGAKNILPNFDLHFLYQMNKLLVPSPDTIDGNNNGILDHKEQSIVSGMFGSFTDASGGTQEEWREISHSIALEARYHFTNKMSTALRTGYFYEHETKGGRQYFQLGGNVNIYGFYANVLWYLPSNRLISSPLDNTVSVSLGYLLNLP